jgi:hypothetical protein
MAGLCATYNTILKLLYFVVIGAIHYAGIVLFLYLLPRIIKKIYHLLPSWLQRQHELADKLRRLVMVITLIYLGDKILTIINTIILLYNMPFPV